MNIHKSYTENLVFNEKPTNSYNGGAGGDPLHANIDNQSPYPHKVLTGGMPIHHILSKSTPHIKALSHLGVPLGLITTSFASMRGGSRKSIATQKSTSYNDDLSNKLFSKIEHAP
jgi:hypothetical protein